MPVRVTTLKGSGRSILDYLDHPQLGLSLYYSHDAVDDPGVWTGRGAEELALSGQVDGLLLQRLLDGRHPDDNAQLGYAYGEHSARGYDVTFNAPKTVSLLWAFGDKHIRDEVTAAHTAALAAVIDFADMQAHTRVTTNGDAFVVDARGLAVATFCQHTSRTDDPHLHTHAVVVAKVQDPRGRWLALDARMIKHDPRTLSALYHAGVRAELTRRLGVTWEPPEHGTAEIVGMPPRVLEWFSTRTGQVEARYQLKLDRFRSTMGRDPSRREEWRLKREAAADSRPSKHRNLTLSELQRRWSGELRDLGLHPDQLVGQVIGRQLEPAGISARAGQVLVHDALVELQDTVSTWRRNDVIREIARRIPTVTTADAQTLTDWVGKAADGGLEQLIELAPTPASGMPTRSDGRPITESTLDRRLTTNHILREEEFVATWAVARFETTGAINLRAVTEGLDHAQASAVRAVAGTDPLVLVVGPAGTGKTAMLRAAGAGLAGAGRPVFGLAPSATAAAVLTAHTGIRADTVDKLLYEHHRASGPLDPIYRLPPGTTVIVDEAGMLATPKLAELARLSDAQRWRVVLVGDPYQLGAVGRGGMFTHLCATGRVYELDRVHRFHEPWERAASLRLRTGDTDVLAVYEKHGRLHDGSSAAVTRDILTAWHTARCAGESVVMLAVTNESVERLNQLAQQIRIDLGHVDPHRYATVGGMRLHVGDEIVTRANDRMLRTDHGVMIRNRAGWTVTGITGAGLTVHGHDGAALLPAAYVRESVELGYARTVHAAQGLTVDHSLLLVDGPVEGRAVYVGMTRGQLSNDAYVAVDDKMHTARDVLEQAIAADWADRPAIDVRAELHHDLGRAPIVTDRRLGHLEPLPDAELKKLFAEQRHIRSLNPTGHARELQRHQRDDTADRHLRDSYQRRHDILTHQRVELTGQRAQLGLITLPGTRRDLDDQIDRTERDLKETNSKIARLERQITERGPRITFERTWLDQHGGLGEREDRIGALLKLDATARGHELSYDPPAHLIARLGDPPLGDEQALLTWERDAGQLEQQHIALPERLHVALERGIENALDITPSHDLGRSVADDFGLGL